MNGASSRENRAERDAEFRRRLDDAKDRKNLSDIVGRRTKLKRRGGREMVGLCPFHDEKTPSFEVNDAKGFYHCHGCGAAGDHFTFLTKADGLSFRQAYEALTGDAFPTVDPVERARQRKEDEKLRLSAIDDARYVYHVGSPIKGTPGERYLREVRGITAVPSLVRFGRVPASRDENGNWKRPWPAVIFPVHHEQHGIIGVQRIFITDDGSGKRWGKASKLSLGRPRGGAVRLGPARDEVIICEGPEDGLTLAQEIPERSVWVALGTAMIPEIEYPAKVTSVVIAGQNDAPGVAAVEKAEASLLERGFAVRTMWPQPPFKDWNDQLRGVTA